jgi:hypothetical protein
MPPCAANSEINFLKELNMTLEEQLARIMEEHSLTCLSINAYRRADGSLWFGSDAHAGTKCASDTAGKNSNCTDALTDAINELNEKRYKAVDIARLVALGEPVEGQADA